MKIYKLFLLLVILFSLTLNACRDGFDAINTNPNNTTIAEPEYIFGLTEVNTMMLMGGDYNWIIFGNYTNQISVIGGTFPSFGYDGRQDGVWSSMYVNGVFPLVQIIKQYGDNPAYSNRVNIAKIWKSYILSEAVAIWGPIPYTQAGLGSSYIPYDDEKTVYTGLLKDLKDAYTALNVDGDTYPAAAEPFLGSDITKWSRFAHSLRLRIASRITDQTVLPDLATTAKQVLAEELDNAEKGLLLKSNTDNCTMTFGSDLPHQNPFYSEIKNKVPAPGLGDYPLIHESLILYMSPLTYNDPTISKIMTKGDGGTKKKPFPTYFGRPSTQRLPAAIQSAMTSNIYDAAALSNYSQLATAYAIPTASLMILSYPEICCIRAEAVYKGYWAGKETAEQYYNDAIAARCARYGVDGTAYTNSAGIKWSTPADTVTGHTNPITKTKIKRTDFYDYIGLSTSYLGGSEDNFKRIVVQHWLSLFYQGIDCWTLLRRTQVMQFPPHWSCDGTTAYVVNPNITNSSSNDDPYAYIPQRLVYSTVEKNINTRGTTDAINNLMIYKIDELPVPILLCKDVIPFPGYPNNAKNVVNK